MLTIIAGTLILCQLINVIAEKHRSASNLSGQARTLISLFAGLLRIAVTISAILLLADIMDLPYQGVIAGLGIGGLAVALAVQSTLQNFIGGITFYADRPTSVGGFCSFGDKLGTVEYIGFRSTRIRALDRTVIIIPNSDFSNMTLIEQAGTQFAFPSLVEYQASDQKSDPSLVKSAEPAVAKWRSDGKLPFPDFDWRGKSEMSGKLDYPPEGSILSEELKTPFGQVPERDITKS